MIALAPVHVNVFGKGMNQNIFHITIDNSRSDSVY